MTAVLLVWGAVLVFAAANSVIQLLTQFGAANPVEGRNAISFCNVLFVGNLCAAVTLFTRFRKAWTREALGRLSGGDWAMMTVVALLSGALAPSFLFLAIENTTVTNVVLVGRLEPLLILLLGMLVLKDFPDKWAAGGTLLAVAGAVTAFLLQGGGPETFGKGEYQAAAGAATLALSTIISKRRLARIPLGIFSTYRTALGTVFFFVAAVYLFGIGHFMDAFSPVLWQWMVVYGAVIVVGGQLLWFKGISTAAAQDISLATSFSPIAGLAFAFLLLDEVPTPAVLTGAAIILGGILCAQVGRALERKLRERREAGTAEAVEHEGEVVFRGV